MARRHHADLVTLAIFLAVLAVYAVTAAPSVTTLFDDSLEFQVVLPTLGIAHPSGYPLYTLLGSAFVALVPFRDPAGRANLFSAVAAAAAVACYYRLAQRWSGRATAAAIAALALAISPTWWSQATLAEVYPLHALLVAAFLCLLLGWEETVAHCRPSDRRLEAAALVAGLALAHHRTFALLLPAALLFVCLIQPSLLRQPRRWLRPILFGLAPLLLYLYLPIRGVVTSSIDGSYVATVQGTLDWILARAYNVFLTGNPFAVQRGVGYFPDLLRTELGLGLLAAALVGLLAAWRTGARRYVFLLAASLLQLGFSLLYKVEDAPVFFIPVTMMAGLWAAAGLAWVADQAERLAGRLRWGRRSSVWSGKVIGPGIVVLLGLLALAPALSVVGSGATSPDRSREWAVYDYGQDMIDSLPAGGEVVGLLGETTLLRYFRDVLGQRPDIRLVAADAEAARYRAVDGALADGILVFLTRDLPGAAQRYSLSAVGPLIAVRVKASPSAGTGGQVAGAGLTLVGSKLSLRSTHAGSVLRAEIDWTAGVAADESLKVSACLLDGSGRQLAQDDQIPVHFAYPTTAWVSGEIVHDVYNLTVPPGTPRGPCTILLVLYRAGDGSEVGRVTLPSCSLP